MAITQTGSKEERAGGQARRKPIEQPGPNRIHTPESKAASVGYTLNGEQCDVTAGNFITPAATLSDDL